jgi:hypothetical protein
MDDLDRIENCINSVYTSEWEDDFLQSIHEWALNGRELSEKQEEVLARIEEKIERRNNR